MARVSRNQLEQRSLFDDHEIEIEFGQMDCELHMCSQLEYLDAIDSFPTLLLFVDHGMDQQHDCPIDINEPYVFQGKLDSYHVIRFVKEAVEHRRKSYSPKSL